MHGMEEIPLAAYKILQPTNRGHHQAESHFDEHGTFRIIIVPAGAYVQGFSRARHLVFFQYSFFLNFSMIFWQPSLCTYVSNSYMKWQNTCHIAPKKSVFLQFLVKAWKEPGELYAPNETSFSSWVKSFWVSYRMFYEMLEGVFAY
jgi:hypothetical protein